MRRIVALVIATVFVSACASFTDRNDPKRCAMMFAAAGAVGGTAGAYDYSRNNNDGAAAGIGIGSVVGGAALGYAICALLREEPAPPPPPLPTADADRRRRRHRPHLHRQTRVRAGSCCGA